MIDVPSLILGALLALLGAFFAYLFSWYQRAQETQAKRRLLLKMLRKELSFIDKNWPSYNPNYVLYRDPIYIGSVDTLLNEGVLEYKQQSALIQALMTLRVVLHKYNDFVRSKALTQTRELPDTAHRAIYVTAQERHQTIVYVSDQILELLPVDV